MEDQYKIDPLTKEQFVPKKITQKFATPANRIKFNNMKASKLNQERGFFDKPCKISHRELKALYKLDSKKTYHTYFLEGKGVDFSAYNHLVDTKYGKLPAYYNYALRKMSNPDYYQIIKL
ncbi:hypothetical protein [Yeosuana marina]|uniref:hypothetical protein n=1 Tax=Yeosuana marina TaxID=1565536 RepID=UPI0030EB4D57|tara:strand:- start:1556 stop:1915 length:360 start_codon:yes stop_codon:yes gene_type:complete